MRGCLTLLSCAALLACGGDKEEAAPRGRDEARDRAAAPAPAKPEGPLTVEALLAAKRGVKPFDEWDAALAHITGSAGPPARVDGDLHGWYVKQGEECFALEVVRDAKEKRVDSVLYGPFAAGAPQFDQCAP